MLLPNSNEMAQQGISTRYRNSPGVQRRVINLCPAFPQMLVWSLQAAVAGEANPTYCSYSFFSAGHRKTGVEDCGDASAHGKSCISACSAHELEPLFLLRPFFSLEKFFQHLGEQWGLWFRREIVHFQRKKYVWVKQRRMNQEIYQGWEEQSNLGLTYSTFFANKTYSLSWSESPCFIFGLYPIFFFFLL